MAILVVYNDGTDALRTTRTLESTLGFRADRVYTAGLVGFAARVTPSQRTALGSEARVAFVSDDTALAVADSVPTVAGETVPTGVRRIDGATEQFAHAASSVSVAVMDTGIDLAHPDLNAIDGVSCVPGTKTAQDDNGHGTHVAGTIAARNTGAGVLGVAPGTAVVAVKTFDRSGDGTTSQAICGIDWIIAHAKRYGIAVVNMSFAGVGSSDDTCGKATHDALHRAICKAVSRGLTFVAAAGNGGTEFAATVPAAYPEVLTVTAIADSDGAAGGHAPAPSCAPTEADDTAATFSNYARDAAAAAHSVAAPGVCISSTFLEGSYATASGTSSAAAHVSGVVALCLGTGLAAGPCASRTPSQVITTVLDVAAAHSTPSAAPYYGFVGDPNLPLPARNYGYLVWAGGP